MTVTASEMQDASNPRQTYDKCSLGTGHRYQSVLEKWEKSHNAVLQKGRRIRFLLGAKYMTLAHASAVHCDSPRQILGETHEIQYIAINITFFSKKNPTNRL